MIVPLSQLRDDDYMPCPPSLLKQNSRFSLGVNLDGDAVLLHHQIAEVQGFDAPFEQHMVSELDLRYGFSGHFSRLIHSLRQVKRELLLDHAPDRAVQKPVGRLQQKILGLQIEIHIFHGKYIGLQIEAGSAGQVDYPVQSPLGLNFNDNFLAVAIKIKRLDDDGPAVGSELLVEQQRRHDLENILVKKVGMQGDAEIPVKGVDQLQVRNRRRCLGRRLRADHQICIRVDPHTQPDLVILGGEREKHDLNGSQLQPGTVSPVHQNRFIGGIPDLGNLALQREHLIELPADQIGKHLLHRLGNPLRDTARLYGNRSDPDLLGKQIAQSHVVDLRIQFPVRADSGVCLEFQLERDSLGFEHA